MTEAILGIVAVVSTVGLIVSNALWLKYLRFTINTAVSKTPLEVAQRQQVTEERKQAQPKKEPRPRPEGI